MSGKNLTLRLTCECTNYTYASKASLKAHQKSKVHLAWARHKEIKDLRIRLGTVEKELITVKNDRDWLQTKVLTLMKEYEESMKTIETFRHLNDKLVRQIYTLRNAK